MADFTDLIFRVHPVLADATVAYFDFPNGYGINVVTGPFAYTNAAAPYETAITLHGLLCYDTHITGDVLGYQTAHDVSKVMTQIAALPPTQE